MGWVRRLLGFEKSLERDASTADQMMQRFNQNQERIKTVGSVGGDHYTDHVERVKQLKREKKYQEAVDLLSKLVDATENESKEAGEGWGVAPWYYEQLAILYRKENRYDDEVVILERYERQPKALGAGPGKLAERLKKARQLRDARKTNTSLNADRLLHCTLKPAG